MTAKNVNESPNRTTQQEQPEKPFLPFSIENILRKDFKCRVPVQENSPPTVHQVRSKKTSGNEASTKSAENIFMRLPWLAYTRYCPPKIPRSKPRKGNRKHKLDRNPRIPFSSTQLAALEAKFVDTHYLSSAEVRQLSSLLSVTEHRVKIWFQNRRAREKKTNGTVEETFDVEN
ncbi:homeobox protein MSX-3-like [Actinia tenebrosa]|uniref:Homeobox protein MSX-3-like n=1 Tax=Actinia tenebrosa TaxID=6105 RepID=A0A6P8GYA2_ACTTE|nr:homeobox protein MSX-3-like [Actinia tenebrosa]